MLISADKVGGWVYKRSKHADVILELEWTMLRRIIHDDLLTQSRYI